MKSPFMIVPTAGDGLGLSEPGIAYKAEFPLSVDDCPGTINNLVVTVTPIDDGTRVELKIGIRGNRSESSLMIGELDARQVESLLFGAARIRTISTLQPW